MKNFIEMVNERIKNGDLLTIGMVYGEFHDLDSVIPDSIVADSKIHIKTETGRNITIPEGFELIYDAFDDTYVFTYKEMTYYIS